MIELNLLTVAAGLLLVSLSFKLGYMKGQRTQAREVMEAQVPISSIRAALSAWSAYMDTGRLELHALYEVEIQSGPRPDPANPPSVRLTGTPDRIHEQLKEECADLSTRNHLYACMYISKHMSLLDEGPVPLSLSSGGE